jgi:hypothetical protein
MSKIGSICFQCEEVCYQITHEEVAHAFINGLVPTCPVCDTRVFLFDNPQQIANQQFWGEDDDGNKLEISVIAVMEDDKGNFELKMSAKKVVE